MNLHNPVLVLVPDTSLAHVDASAPASAKFAASTSLLVQCIQDEFPGVPVEPVLRKYWNEEAGECLVTSSEAADEAESDYMRDFLFGH